MHRLRLFIVISISFLILSGCSHSLHNYTYLPAGDNDKVIQYGDLEITIHRADSTKEYGNLSVLSTIANKSDKSVALDINNEVFITDPESGERFGTALASTYTDAQKRALQMGDTMMTPPKETLVIPAGETLENQAISFFKVNTYNGREQRSPYVMYHLAKRPDALTLTLGEEEKRLDFDKETVSTASTGSVCVESCGNMNCNSGNCSGGGDCSGASGSGCSNLGSGCSNLGSGCSGGGGGCSGF